jgi:argininosuccinate lyase
MTYNRDLQEDKERLFDAMDTVRGTVRIVAAMLRHTEVNANACAGAAGDSSLLATDLADYLVRKGMAFRKAHHVIGALVALAEKSGRKLHELNLHDFQGIDPAFGPDVLKLFDLKQAMAHRNLIGAPGSREVRRQLARWSKLLA